jgi:hypothetical protein
MLFRSITGELNIINKYEYKNDKLYYIKIMELKTPFTKLEKTFDNKNNKQSHK